jgi:hypothetical protein
LSKSVCNITELEELRERIAEQELALQQLEQQNHAQQAVTTR